MTSSSWAFLERFSAVLFLQFKNGNSVDPETLYDCSPIQGQYTYKVWLRSDARYARGAHVMREFANFKIADLLSFCKPLVVRNF